LEPDVTLVDGNGILHPEGFGLASHFGVLMDIPTVGVSKTFLHVDGLSKTDIKEIVASEAKESELHNGVSLIGKSGRCWGVALTGGKGVKNPIYVSVGHCISLKSAVKIVQACCLYRIPEPIRQADLRSREIIRRWEAEGKVDTLLDKCKIQSS
jgi:deoxyinosine 3'endonuclease (endonuclease V)